MEERRIKLSVLFSLLFEKNGMAAKLGITFTLLSVCLFFPLVFFLSTFFKEPFEKYDYETITTNGKSLVAIVTNVSTVSNVTINDEHPKIVEYTYIDNGNKYVDHFKTMDVKEVVSGQEIKISALNGKSVIQGLEKFYFPFGLFYMLPVLFLLFGLWLIIFALIPASAKFNLFKNGLVTNARINLITRPNSISIRNILLIDYSYELHGESFVGKSYSKDFSILNKYKLGDQIKIFYLENKPSESCLVPSSLITLV